MPKPFEGQEIEGTHGFIVPNGEFIALEEVDRMCVYIGSVYDSAERIQKLFGFLAMEGLGVRSCFLTSEDVKASVANPHSPVTL